LLFEHFASKKVIKKKDLPQKEIIYSEMFDIDLPKGQKKASSSALII